MPQRPDQGGLGLHMGPEHPPGLVLMNRAPTASGLIRCAHPAYKAHHVQGGFGMTPLVCCSRLQRAAPSGRSPFAALPLDPFPPQAVVPIGLSPPSVLPLPPWPILPSLLLFSFPWAFPSIGRGVHRPLNSFPFHSLGRLCRPSPRTCPVQGGGVVWGPFRRGKCRGGGEISPPSGIPKLPLPHAHPNMQVHAVHRAVNSSNDTVVLWKPKACQIFFEKNICSLHSVPPMHNR